MTPLSCNLHKYLQWLSGLVLLLLLATAKADLTGFKIGIDPGHGGRDPGAVANGVRESDANLATSLALKEFLEADGATVFMSRTTDVSLTEASSGNTELVTRSRFFNSQGVQYMVSVHHNAAASQANGILAYIARGFCARTSGHLADAIVQRLQETSGLPTMQGARGSSELCADKPGVFQYNVVMVVETAMPAALAEVSFLTNIEEAERFRDPQHVRRNGWAIYAGLVDHIGGGRTPLPFATVQLQVPTIVSPADGVEVDSVDEILLTWENNNPAELISGVRLTIQEAEDLDILPATPVFLGDCDADGLALNSVETVATGQCGARLKANQWYQWQLHFTYTNQETASINAYFKTEGVDVVEIEPPPPEPEFSCDNVTQISVTECEVLLALYQYTDGDNWRDSPDNKWLLSNAVCEWQGITCGSGKVLQITLSNNNLTGTLPVLNELEQLLFLQLDNNQLVGNLPSAASLPPSLKVLNLAGNQFAGELPDYQPLTELLFLQLRTNQLCGDVPVSIRRMRQLQVVDIVNNHLVALDSATHSFLDQRNPGWATTQTSSDACPLLTTPSLIDLGEMRAVDQAGNPLATTATWQGGIAVNGGDFQASTELNPTDSVEIVGLLQADANHVGETADLIVSVAHILSTDPSDPPAFFYLLDSAGTVWGWDGMSIGMLLPFAQITLQATQTVHIYQGPLVPGILQVSLHYRLADDTLVSPVNTIDAVMGVGF